MDTKDMMNEMGAAFAVTWLVMGYTVWRPADMTAGTELVWNRNERNNGRRSTWCCMDGFRWCTHFATSDFHAHDDRRA